MGNCKYGGLETLLEKSTKNYLVEKCKFNEHAIYLLADPILIPEEERVTIVLSSKNLLLHAYHQQDFGVPSYVCIDTTHRLVQEGHCCMAVGTMSITQEFHIIGYGICSHEDVRAHEHVLRAIRDAVNAVIQQRRLDDQPI